MGYNLQHSNLVQNQPVKEILYWKKKKKEKKKKKKKTTRKKPELSRSFGDKFSAQNSLIPRSGGEKNGLVSLLRKLRAKDLQPECW